LSAFRSVLRRFFSARLATFVAFFADFSAAFASFFAFRASWDEATARRLACFSFFFAVLSPRLASLSSALSRRACRAADSASATNSTGFDPAGRAGDFSAWERGRFGLMAVVSFAGAKTVADGP
jgi:hypothetical protein